MENALQLQYDHNSVKVELIDLANASVFSLPFSPHIFKHVIIAVTLGKIKIIDGGQTVEATTSQIYILPAQSVIRGIDKEKSKFWLVLFTEDFLREAVYLANKKASDLLKAEFTHLVPEEATFKVIKKLLLLLYKHHNSSHPYNSPIIFVLTFNLLLSCMAELHAYEPRVMKQGLSRKEHVSFHFLRLASENARLHHDVRYYADRLHMTQGNLTKIVKTTLGNAPKAILEEVLIKLSKEFLDRDPDSIYNIAEELSFKSSSAFINFFKSYTGMTPTEYRNRKT